MSIVRVANKARSIITPIKSKIQEKYSILRYQSTHREVHITMSKATSTRLNLIVPSLNQQEVYGGITTALNILTQLYKKLNCDVRLITLNPISHLSSVVPLFFSDPKNEKFTIKILDIENAEISVRKQDIFIATFWSTALVAENIISQQEKIYSSDNRILYYLIQDYEPGFYPWSTEYIEAERTYKFPIRTVGIFNSKELYDYFHLNGYDFYKSLYFRPTLNSQLKEYLLGNYKNYKIRKKQILIYGRPQEYRNAFSLVINALKVLSKLLGKDASEWKIISLGGKHNDIKLYNGMKIISIGKVPMDEYAKIMLETYAGISLMISPHPSYPPLEMSTFGIKTITNCFCNKNLSYFNQNLICLSTFTSKAIADELFKLLTVQETAYIDINSDYVKSNKDINRIVDFVSTSIHEDLFYEN